ncbi:MAG: type II secretion system protein GspD [Betaproteobacteria bacterium]|nr:MAG: type II secretion system protein GspD [Betaproteobacteria bacterium]
MSILMTLFPYFTNLAALSRRKDAMPQRSLKHLARMSFFGSFVLLLAMGGTSASAQGSFGGTNANANTTLMPRSAASAPLTSDFPPGLGPPPIRALTPEEDQALKSMLARGPVGNSVNAPKMSQTLSVHRLMGSGELVKPSKLVNPPVKTSSGAPVSLSFENGDVREIVRNILGDLLQENYIIDPRVQGTITMRTAKPIDRADVVPLLETILKANGFSLTKDGAYWRVLPASDAVRGLTTPRLVNQVGSADRGTIVVIYPVKNIGAKELQRLVEPFVRDPAAALRIDELRNFAYFTGTQNEIDRMLDLANMFDVSLLAGMSFSMVTLQQSDVKTVFAEYEKIIGQAAGNPFAGLLRMIPIERMNALLLVSPQASVVQEAQSWIERLDQGGDSGNGQKLFVYTLQYTQADKLQPVLQSALSGARGSTAPAATVAPGQAAATLVSPMPGNAPASPGNTAAPAPAARPAAPAGGNNAQGSALARNVSIVADKDRNALLIVATQSEYNAIESVIRKLDIAPKQVAIEVQIAEVSLTGDFQFGLQTYFKGKIDGADNRMTSRDGLGSIAKGAFTYTWKKTDAIQAILNLSESKNMIRTIAQPTLITMENQKASFTSGTQISVRTQSTAASGTVGSTDSFQYINTGISINVTPRVSGQNVFLEIQQEISDAGVAAEGNPNPPITKRSASTNVMVGSGDTMLMGGLFQEGGRTASSGLPVLSSIPVVGGLFGSQRWQSDRTELVLLLTPRVLNSADETNAAVDELRKRLQSLENSGLSASTLRSPTTAADRALLREKLQAIETPTPNQSLAQ